MFIGKKLLIQRLSNYGRWRKYTCGHQAFSAVSAVHRPCRSEWEPGLLAHGRNGGIGRDSLVDLLDRFLIVVDVSFSQVPCFTIQDILLETILKCLLSWEAHPHFLHKKALQNAKIGSTSQLFCGVGCASFCYFC